MITTNRMQLKVWNDLDDQYNHTDLAANWQRIDDHDHTNSWGKQIPNGGIESNAISQDKIQDFAVGTNEIQDGAVTHGKLSSNAVDSSNIADGSVQGIDIGAQQIGIGHMTLAALAAILPLGTIIPWFRPAANFDAGNGAGLAPKGWAICDGSVVASVNHDWGTGGNVTIPDLRNRFILGAATSGTGTGVGTPPSESVNGTASTGGAHTRNMQHTHPVPSHFHISNPHTHGTVAHAHTVPNHAHPIQGDDAHNHQLRTRGVWVLDGPQAVVSEMMVQAAYVSDVNAGGGDLGVPGIPAHSHGGATLGSGAFGTDAQAPNTGTQSDAGMSSVALTTSNNDTTLGADLRPAYVGLLYIIKVQHPRP